MPRMIPNWTWTLNSQKYPAYTRYLPREAQILVRFALRPAVSKISHILQFPIDNHVKRPKKKEQKTLPKIQNFEFHYSFNNFGRDLP